MMRCNERPGAGGARALRSGIAVAMAAAVAACSSDDGMEPPDVGFTLTVVDGEQVAATGAVAPDPIVVRLTDTATGAPEEEATITWSVITGSGARLLPATSTTDSLGLASTLLEVGSVAGDYTVQASATAAEAVSVTVRAFASAPTLTSITPSAVSPGQTVTVAGSGFSDRADDNAVFFGSNRAEVASASPSELLVTVPPCMATADADVTVRLGPLVSNALTASVTGDARTALSLGLGESRVFSSAADLECTVLSGDAGEAYVVVLGNADTDPLDRIDLRLVGQPESVPATLLRPTAAARTSSAPGPHATAQDRFELGLRALERSLTSAAPLARTTLPPGAAASRVWQIGQRDDFQVFNGNGFDFTTVTAEVVFTSARAVLFEDVNTPANGFTEADYAAFAAEFDDPIYDRDVDVFGQPSDIDGNGRIIILFTPVVNELTPPNSDGFVA
ncbi:MAG TPA: IPT/TIG domain-containing protein, partial [Longimicrobiales bacterium]|nr:IPT/TIG domain-containing protein [Longimicrobiales bacterium]